MAANLAALTSLAGHRTCNGTTFALGAVLSRFGSSVRCDTCAAFGTGAAAVMMSSLSSVALVTLRFLQAHLWIGKNCVGSSLICAPPYLKHERGGVGTRIAGNQPVKAWPYNAEGIVRIAQCFRYPSG